MFRRILVPVDGSTFAEHAIPVAARIVVSTRATLELALVHTTYPVTDAIVVSAALGEWEREQRRREAEYLPELARRLEKSTAHAVDPVLLDGDVVATLEQEIKDRGVDLVVMTTHGRAGLARAWLGSVADALIRHVDTPVLLIRPGDESVNAQSSAPPFKHVLVALDGSERAERALTPALALARLDSARITLLRVVFAPNFPAQYIPFTVPTTSAELQDYENDARAYIDDQLQTLQLDGIDTKGEVLFDYSTAQAVLRFAETNGVDLIALGSHGRGAVKRVLLGSVSDKIVRAADVPVLVC